jgi:hypothetical protein
MVSLAALRLRPLSIGVYTQDHGRRAKPLTLTLSSRPRTKPTAARFCLGSTAARVHLREPAGMTISALQAVSSTSYVCAADRERASPSSGASLHEALLQCGDLYSRSVVKCDHRPAATDSK